MIPVAANRVEMAALPRRWTKLIPAPITFAVLACSVVAFLAPEFAAVLEFNRGAIAAGQWWRVWTGHLAHFGGEHLFWDAGMFGVLAWILERRSPCRFALCLATAAGVISAALWIGRPDLQTYRGLSGVDTALFALLAAELLIETRFRSSLPALLLLGLAAKLAYECVTGGVLFVNAPSAGFAPVPLAHVAGAVVGLAFAAGPTVFPDQSARSC